MAHPAPPRRRAAPRRPVGPDAARARRRRARSPGSAPEHRHGDRDGGEGRDEPGVPPEKADAGQPYRAGRRGRQREQRDQREECEERDDRPAARLRHRAIVTRRVARIGILKRDVSIRSGATGAFMADKIQRVLVVTAHPDDSEFGAGGTIAKFGKDGCEITYVIVTNGNKGSGDRTMTPERLAA